MAERISISRQIKDIDIQSEWTGMPECRSESFKPIKSIKVNFLTLTDMEAFAKLIGQPVLEGTRSIWYPQSAIRKYADKEYRSES